MKLSNYDGKNIICSKCTLEKTFEEFGTYSLHEEKYVYKTCKTCRKFLRHQRWNNYKTENNIKDLKQFQKYEAIYENNILIKIKCASCLLEKELLFFNKNSKSNLGYSKYCKICKKEKDKKNYLKHKKKYNKRNKQYYADRKEQISNFIKNKRKNDPEFIKKEFERSKKYRLKNKEILKKKKKKYYEENKKKIHAQMLKRKNQNINIRLKQNLRSRIWHALKNGNKKENFEELIGCSVEELKQNLESKFYSNMSWNNYGSVWHIDHVKPCCLFDMTIKEQRLECFNYKNLQPLLAEENLSKNRFYEETSK